MSEEPSKDPEPATRPSLPGYAESFMTTDAQHSTLPTDQTAIRRQTTLD